MKLIVVPGSFAVCRFAGEVDVNGLAQPWFLARTQDEVSLVCRSECVPAGGSTVEDGWALFKVGETLEFDLVGVIAQISRVLADEKIPVFVVSTFLTDYVLVKTDRLPDAIAALTKDGHVYSPPEEGWQARRD